MTTLAQLAPGQSARIDKIETTGPNTQRLMAMGVLPGCVITLLQVAPLGDPLTISISGRKISFRKSDAACVHLDPLA